MFNLVFPKIVTNNLIGNWDIVGNVCRSQMAWSLTQD